MKKLCAFLMALVLAVSLCACGSDSDPGAAATPEPQGEATPTPSPTPVPTATPFPRVPVEKYVLQWKNDTARGMNYMVPTHWVTGESGERYITFYEPVPAGESGFRIAFVNKKKNSEPDAYAMRAELRNLISAMEETYSGFYCDGEISREYSLVRFVGYSSNYTFVDEYGERRRGFVIIATYNRRIYCMNFSGPEARFDEMQPIGNKILESVSRISTSN